MIENMFIGKPPGNYDRILDFSTAVTGSLFFVPTATFLDNVDPQQPIPAASLTEQALGTKAEPMRSSAPAASKDGSLGIGSLKGEHSDE